VEVSSVLAATVFLFSFYNILINYYFVGAQRRSTAKPITVAPLPSFESDYDIAIDYIFPLNSIDNARRTITSEQGLLASYSS
jgi:hypothetical protein